VDSALGHDTATADDQAGRSPARTPALPGDAGFWTFIAADATLFALLFFQFSLDRSSHVSVFEDGQASLLVPLGGVNTLVLITSSLLMAMAIRSADRRQMKKAARFIGGTVSLGIVFAVLKVVEYVVEIDSGHALSTSSFFMYYFVITGIHLLHLIVGVIALVIIGSRIRHDSGGTRDRVMLECGAAYWHLIDLLWMFIFPLIYLVR
jgi:nitric oxide reductase NorE protein